MIKKTLVALFSVIALMSAVLVIPSSAQAEELTVATPGPIAWSPDGQYAYVGIGEFFTAGSGVIKRVKLSDGTVSDVVTMNDPANCHAYVNTLAITPDGNTLYAGGYSCIMTIDLTTNTYTSSYTGNDWAQKIVVGSDAAYAVFPEGGAVFKATKSAGVWGSTWSQLVAGRFAGPVSRSAALSADGATLYVGSEGQAVRVINTSTGAETALAGTSPAFAVATSPDGSYLLVLDGGREIKRVELTGANAGVVTSASYGSDWMVRKITIDTTGTFAYLGGQASRSILKINTSDLSVVNRTDLGLAYPTLVTLGRTAPDDLVASPVAGSNGVLASAMYLNRLLVFPMAPTAPGSLSATAGDASAEISFTPAQDQLSSITNYEYRVNGTGSWTALSPADTTSPVTIPNLTNGSAVSLELRAVNSVGNGAASSGVSVTPLGVPGAPTSVRVTTSTDQATVNFTAPANDGGFAITNYELTTNGGGTWTPMSPAVTTGPLSVSGLSSGTNYQFAVRAVNSLGAGASSAVVAASTSSLASGGTSTFSEPTPTPSPTATSDSSTAVAPAPVAVTETIPAGESLIVVNGVTTRVAVNVVDGRKWQVKGADFTLEFIPQAELGELDGSFTARAGTSVEIRGDGFLPGSLIASYLPGALADSLGKATVNGDSTFVVQAVLPASLQAGQYVFQVNGLGTATSVRSVNLGLQLLAADVITPKNASKRVMFGSSSAVMTAKAKKSLASWVATHKKSAKSALIVPTVKQGAGAQEKAIAVKRASAVRSSLTQMGFTKPIRIAAKVRVARDVSAERRTTVWLRTSPPSSRS